MTLLQTLVAMHLPYIEAKKQLKTIFYIAIVPLEIFVQNIVSIEIQHLIKGQVSEVEGLL
jgi:hypothetical protein